jgi:uncharacterized protein YegP (UPF0339 family)
MSPIVEIYQEQCGTCVGTGSIESSDSTDDSWWDCRVCEGTGKRGWRWRLKGENGEIVAVGESYTRRADAVRGWETAKRLMATANFEVA